MIEILDFIARILLIVLLCASIANEKRNSERIDKLEQESESIKWHLRTWWQIRYNEDKGEEE